MHRYTFREIFFLFVVRPFRGRVKNRIKTLEKSIIDASSLLDNYEHPINLPSLLCVLVPQFIFEHFCPC